MMSQSTKDDPGEAREVSCFVIGPIGNKIGAIDSTERIAYEEGVEVLEEVIQPACAAFGITPVRADGLVRAGEIPEQVFRALRDAHLVVADLTGANANVMYELGLRHTTGKLTIQLGEHERLPFDVASIRTILFRRTPNGLIEARRQLTAAIADGLLHGGDPVTATRIWFEYKALPATTAAAESHGSAGMVDDEEPGFLEKLAAAAEGFDSLMLNLEAMTAVLNEINRRTTDSRVQIEAVNAAGRNPSVRLSLANLHAQNLEQPASRLEVLVGDYRQSVERLHPGMMYALSEAKRHVDTGDPEAAKAEAFRQQVREFISSIDATWPTLEAFRRTLLEAGEAARSVRRVNGRIAAALQQQAGTAALFDQWRGLL